MPAELFRFQRRDSFRVRTPATGSPMAHLRHPARPDVMLALRVRRREHGRLRPARCPTTCSRCRRARRIENVRVELDPDTRFDATFTLQHVTAFDPNSRGARIGCRMSGLSGEAQRALQRYIDQTQKKRRLLSLD